MISTRVSVIVVLVALVNGARNGEPGNSKSQMKKHLIKTIVITQFSSFRLGESVQTEHEAFFSHISNHL